MAITLLIAEDSSDTRFVYRMLFDKDDRFEIVGDAATAPEAIELAGSLKPDVVLLDINMPGAEGLEAIGDIVARIQGMVIVNSGSVRPDIEAEVIAAGASAFVDKFDSPAALPERVASIYARSSEG